MNYSIYAFAALTPLRDAGKRTERDGTGTFPAAQQAAESGGRPRFWLLWRAGFSPRGALAPPTAARLKPALQESSSPL